MYTPFLKVASWVAMETIQFHITKVVLIRGLIIRNRSVWPTLFLLNVFTAFKGTHLYIYISFEDTIFACIEHLGYIFLWMPIRHP